MKVVHKQETIETKNDLLKRAMEAEQGGELKQAATLYQKVVKMNPTDEVAYNRLMLIYRKEKDYKKEMATIRAGIKAFEELYDTSSRFKANTSIARISKRLLKSTGLANKKGESIYQAEPLGKWKRRKLIVEKKLSK
jgi:hypothetical protein